MATEPRDQRALTEEALRLKQANADSPHHPENDDHADQGIRSIPFEDQPPSGAFDAEGHRPVLERSRRTR
ncbi:hypothetical protein [Sphingomonas sp. Y38-1Y]|jgi:hypothetical protein|uniref:hypothetical protein n=1 Tax=Sphingomonas sp. Y38-1Y TaxID=3078265 RepID=UPI0028E2322B|nr:hypothetical protein [Sphingomonas sp. Y38-1Y]